MSGQPPAKPGGGLSLYADLLDPPGESSASISRAPQVSQQALDAVKEQEAAAAKKTDSSLRFNPIHNIRRPQQKTQKPKATFPKTAGPAATSTTTGNASGNGSAAGGGAAAAAATAVPVKSTLADWANTDEDEWAYAGERRPRNKKKKKKAGLAAETDWNEIYDPSRPTNVDEYLRSDERIREVRDWKALLYRHKRPVERKRQSSWDSEEDEDRPMGSMFSLHTALPAAWVVMLTQLCLSRSICSSTFILIRAATRLATTTCSPSTGARRCNG